MFNNPSLDLQCLLGVDMVLFLPVLQGAGRGGGLSRRTGPCKRSACAQVTALHHPVTRASQQPFSGDVVFVS